MITYSFQTKYPLHIVYTLHASTYKPYVMDV